MNVFNEIHIRTKIDAIQATGVKIKTTTTHAHIVSKSI